MSQSIRFTQRKVLKGNNRRRNGYELTRQRDMVPVILGAVMATICMHVALYWAVPHVIEYNHKEIELSTAETITQRVVVREKPISDDYEMPEDPPELDQKEPEEMETPDVDILDAQFEELIMAQTDTVLVLNSGPELKAATLDPIIQTELQQADDSILKEEKLSVIQDEWSSPDKTPFNANETAINIPPMTPHEAYDEGNIAKELEKEVKDLSYLPKDTRLLSDLLNEKELNSSSGVARMGADLLFAFDESKLSPTAEPSLQILAVLILNNPNTYFIIEGHTDTLGDEKGPAYNADLSLHRAARVRAWLQEAGVPVERVYIRACASRNTISPKEHIGDKDKEAVNRRVEIHMRSDSEFKNKPIGCLDHNYKVDLSTPIKTLIKTNPTHPQTYDSVNKYNNEMLNQIADDDDAQTATE